MSSGSGRPPQLVAHVVQGRRRKQLPQEGQAVHPQVDVLEEGMRDDAAQECGQAEEQSPAEKSRNGRGGERAPPHPSEVFLKKLQLYADKYAETLRFSYRFPMSIKLVF